MESSKRVYLDYASTTPVDRRVLDAMLPYLTVDCGNPSSMHSEGRNAKKAIEKSRARVAEIIGVKPNEVIFTSGGTEADNLAVLGIARANQGKGRHIITSVIEHKAVLDACKQLENEGFEVTRLDVDGDGLVSVDQLAASLRTDTILVSVMYANNEVGSIQPIKEIANVIKDSLVSSPVFHIDACQASGALPIDIRELGVDAMTISASKIYGPKGIGCLYVSEKVSIRPIMLGGGQERGLRSGTENVASIVGLAEALRLAEEKRASESARLADLRDYFWSKIHGSIDDAQINGGMDKRLSNNLNLSFRGVEGESLMLMLDDMGVACSTGSACSSADLNPSHVLVALGVPLELAHCSVRFTLGRYTTKEDIDYATNVLEKSITRIRSMSSVK